MRQFSTLDCGRGAMFMCCMHAASKYVSLMVIGMKHNPFTQNLASNSPTPLKSPSSHGLTAIAELLDDGKKLQYALTSPETDVTVLQGSHSILKFPRLSLTVFGIIP